MEKDRKGSSRIIIHNLRQKEEEKLAQCGMRNRDESDDQLFLLEVAGARK